MKTAIKTTIIQWTLLVILIVSSILITRPLIHTIKDLYQVEGKGKGIACFFDMIQ